MARWNASDLAAGWQWAWAMSANLSRQNLRCLHRQRQGGTIAARYFMPWEPHPTMAVTGAQCLASCAMTPGSIADGLLTRPTTSPATVTIEHPSGTIDVVVDYNTAAMALILNSAGLVRTARKLASGNLFVSD